MTFQILTLEESKGASCNFEEWSKEKKSMCDCGKQAICSMGKQFLCVEHLPDALVRCGQVTMLDEKTGKKSVYPHVYSFKEDFLNACKEKAKERNII
jgi:hypothetical protein